MTDVIMQFDWEIDSIQRHDGQLHTIAGLSRKSVETVKRSVDNFF